MPDRQVCFPLQYFQPSPHLQSIAVGYFPLGETSRTAAAAGAGTGGKVRGEIGGELRALHGRWKGEGRSLSRHPIYKRCSPSLLHAEAHGGRGALWQTDRSVMKIPRVAADAAKKERLGSFPRDGAHARTCPWQRGKGSAGARLFVQWVLEAQVRPR